MNQIVPSAAVGRGFADADRPRVDISLKRLSLSCGREMACFSDSSTVHVSGPKRIEIGRDTATNLPVLAECNWRFSVVEVDNSIVPNNSPKSKPLIGATRELLLFTIASIGADQSEDWIVGSFWGQRNCCHPLPH